MLKGRKSEQRTRKTVGRNNSVSLSLGVRTPLGISSYRYAKRERERKEENCRRCLCFGLFLLQTLGWMADGSLRVLVSDQRRAIASGSKQRTS